MKRIERYYALLNGRITPTKGKWGKISTRLDADDKDIIYWAADEFIGLGEKDYLYSGGTPPCTIKIHIWNPVEVSRQKNTCKYRRDLTLDIMPPEAEIPLDLANLLAENHFIQNSLA